MTNFVYSVPTQIIFGKGQIEHLGENMKSYGKKALLVYGGGSIKKTGIYDAVKSQLKKYSIEAEELSGVEPNPKIASVRKGVEICKSKNIDMLLAVGGGSSIDCAKAVAAGACYKGDAWELVKDRSKIQKALPVFTVLTLAATGSEMNRFAVISNPETNEKLGTGSDLLKPKVSILDPEYTFTVPQKQTAAGTADIMSHIFENYFNNVKSAFVQSRFAESLLKACIKYGKTAYDDPTNYEARANLMWTSSLAINGLLSCGADVTWSVHAMEHQLSAFYDITHGVGLAILTPNWMTYVLCKSNLWKFAEYGMNVWGIDGSLEPLEIAKLSIRKTRDFFRLLGLPSTLSEVGIGKENFEIMAERALQKGLQGAFLPFQKDDILKIYEASL